MEGGRGGGGRRGQCDRLQERRESEDLWALRGQQQEQLSRSTDSDEAADSHLHESSAAILLRPPPPPLTPPPSPPLPPGLLFTKRGGFLPLRPFSSALRQSDC